MLPFTHFSVGAAVGLFLCFLLIGDIEMRLLVSLPVILLAGAISMAPDIGHFIPLFAHIETHILGNLFFFHTFLDSINSTDVFVEVVFSSLLQLYVFLTIIENRVRVVKRRRQNSYIAGSSK